MQPQSITITTHHHAAARDELRRDLIARLDRAQADVVLLALHIGSGAFAVGITGPIGTGDPPQEIVDELVDVLTSIRRSA